MATEIVFYGKYEEGCDIICAGTFADGGEFEEALDISPEASDQGAVSVKREIKEWANRIKLEYAEISFG